MLSDRNEKVKYIVSIFMKEIAYSYPYIYGYPYPHFHGDLSISPSTSRSSTELNGISTQFPLGEMGASNTVSDPSQLSPDQAAKNASKAKLQL